MRAISKLAPAGCDRVPDRRRHRRRLLPGVSRSVVALPFLPLRHGCLIADADLGLRAVNSSNRVPPNHSARLHATDSGSVVGRPSVNFQTGFQTLPEMASRLSSTRACYSSAKRFRRFQVIQPRPRATPAGGIAKATMPRLRESIARPFWNAAVSRHMGHPCPGAEAGTASRSARANSAQNGPGDRPGFAALRVTASVPAVGSCPGRSSRT